MESSHHHLFLQRNSALPLSYMIIDGVKVGKSNWPEAKLTWKVNEVTLILCNHQERVNGIKPSYDFRLLAWKASALSMDHTRIIDKSQNLPVDTEVRKSVSILIL